MNGPMKDSRNVTPKTLAALGLSGMALVLAACTVHVQTDSSGSSTPSRSSKRTATAKPKAAAPAPAPTGNGTTSLGLGRRPVVAPTSGNASGGSAPAIQHVAPLGATATGAAALPDVLNVAKLQELKLRNPKGCGYQEVAPSVWVKMDCHAYTPSSRAVMHLTPRKAKAVAQGKTSWKSLSALKSQFGTLSVKTTPFLFSKKSGAAGGERANNVGGSGDVRAETFPGSVDHRTDRLEGPIKDQGPVGSCTAFSLSTTIDNAAIRAGKLTSGDRNLAASPNHIWSGYGLPQMGTAADANLGRTISTQQIWPQSHRDACKLGNPDYEDCGKYLSPSVTPGTWQQDQGLVSRYDASNAGGAYKIAGFEKLQTLPPNMDELVSILASGSDLWVAMKIDGYAWSNSKMKAGVIPDWSEPSGGHAITMSGYRDTPTGRQFLIHNSWGTSWGDGGYAWVSQNMVQKYMHYAYKVKLSDGVKRENLTDDDCAPDELVDIQTGICAVMCPDDTRPNGGC